MMKKKNNWTKTHVFGQKANHKQTPPTGTNRPNKNTPTASPLRKPGGGGGLILTTSHVVPHAPVQPFPTPMDPALGRTPFRSPAGATAFFRPGPSSGGWSALVAGDSASSAPRRAPAGVGDDHSPHPPNQRDVKN